MARSLDEQTNSLAAYLPSGRAFSAKNRPGTVTRGILEGLAGELIRNEALIKEFRDEIIPDKTVLFISEWERALGIPDQCFTGSGSDDERRRDVLAKLASLGVQTADDMRLLALQIYAVNLEIRNPTRDPTLIFPYTFNPVAGDPDVDGDAGRFFFGLSDREARFQIIVEFQDLPIASTFPYTFPMPFLTRDIGTIECLFAKLRPANVGFTEEIPIASQSPAPTPVPSGFEKQLKSLDYDTTFGMSTPTADRGLVGITDTFSMAVWAKNLETVSATQRGLVAITPGGASNADRIQLYMDTGSNDDVEFEAKNSSTTTRQFRTWFGVVPDSGPGAPWHHYVITWGGATGTGANGIHFYVDGVDQGTGTIGTDLDGTGMGDATVRELHTGFNISGAADTWIGPMYSSAFWNTVLTSAEISAIYNGGNARDIDLESDSGAYVSSADLVHYFRLGLGTTVQDFGRDHIAFTSDLSMEGVTTDPDATDLVSDIPL